MVPGYTYRVWGVLCGINQIDLGRGKILQWVYGALALNHLNIGNPFVVAEAFNDNEVKVA